MIDQLNLRIFEKWLNIRYLTEILNYHLLSFQSLYSNLADTCNNRIFDTHTHTDKRTNITLKIQGVQNIRKLLNY